MDDNSEDQGVNVETVAKGIRKNCRIKSDYEKNVESGWFMSGEKW